MGLAFFLFGALATFIFILNNLWRTVRRQQAISFWGLLLAFMVALLPITGLIVDNLEDARFDLLEQLMFLLIIPLLITHVALTVIDLVRPKRRRSGRGVLGVGIAVLLLGANMSYALVSRTIELTRTSVVVRPTPINTTPSFLDPCSFEVIGVEFLDILLGRLANDAGLSVDALLAVFVEDGSATLGQLVRANEGNPLETVGDITDAIEQLLLEKAVICEDIPSIGIPLIVRTQIEPRLVDAIDADFDTLLLAFESFGAPGVEAPPTSADPVTPAPAQLQATRAAIVAAIPTLEIPPTATFTLTPTITPSLTPTQTRTPFPTSSPTPTRERFVTATPSPTPTLPSPCLATASFNVNMRSLPDLEEGDIVLTIPFEAAFAVFASNADRTWWYAEYEGEAGWVSDEFIRLTSACFDLPTRRP